MVPSVALVLLWAISSDRLWSQWQVQSAQDDFASRAGVPAAGLYFALQDERLVTAQALNHPATPPAGLRAARTRTDSAVRAVQGLAGIDQNRRTAHLGQAVDTTVRELRQLAGARQAVDHGTLSQAAAFTYYTGLLTDDLGIFDSLGHADNGIVTFAASNLNDLFRAGELLSQEDALLARDQVTGADREQLVEWIGAQHYLFASRVAPDLPPDDLSVFLGITAGADWQGKTAAETALLDSPPGASSTSPVVQGQARVRWQGEIDRITPRLRQLMNARGSEVDGLADNTLRGLLARLILISSVGLIAAVLVMVTTIRLTGSLRRRIFALRDEALALQAKLPDVVERLRGGESVDIAAEVAEVAHGGDELGRLGDALNIARHSAVETAVRQAEQHRGFERLLQRIARRTQLLIGLQLKKLDQLERRHEDPEVLEGLFDLDHLTARLRRYEESLVILGRRPAAAALAPAGSAPGRAARRAGRGPGLPPHPDRDRGPALDLRAGGRPDGPHARRADGERRRLLPGLDAGGGTRRGGRPGRHRRDRGPGPRHGARPVP